MLTLEASRRGCRFGSFHKLFRIAIWLLMPVSLFQAFLICSAAFIASIFGIVVGGHSFITVPLMIFSGLPPAAAIATNRFATLFLGVLGLRNYYRYGKLDMSFALPFAVSAVLGSIFGSLYVLSADQLLVKRVISIVMLGLVVMVLVRPNIGVEGKEVRRGVKWMLVGLPISFVLGLYWGFFGGGGTTLLIFFLVSLYGMRFLEGVANSNLIGFAASLVAAAIFILKGAIFYELGILLGAAMGAGAYLGSKLSIRVGNVWVRRVFLAATLIMAAKLLIG